MTFQNDDSRCLVSNWDTILLLPICVPLNPLPIAVPCALHHDFSTVMCSHLLKMLYFVNLLIHLLFLQRSGSPRIP